MTKREEVKSETARREFVFTREINAPRKLVWEAYTKAEHLKHWWGPKGMEVEVEKFDLRPGGTFLYSMAVPNAGKMYGKFVYREIVSPEKLVYIVSFTDAEGTPIRHPLSATFPLEVLNIMTLTEENGKTKLHMTGYPINATDEEHATYDASMEGMSIGFNGTMSQLDTYLEDLKTKRILPPTSKVDLQVIDRAYVISRTFNAPRSLVYKAWSDPDHFAKWWGPHTFTTPDCVMDMKVGGKFLAVMRSPEGEDNALRGEFKEIRPEEKIVLQMDTEGHTRAWHEIVNKARGLAADAPSANPLTTVIFEALGSNQTKVIIEQRFENNRDRDAFISLGTGEGWSQSFVKMDSLLATLGTEKDIIIMRTLNAPRELVWKAWTEPAHVVKWFGPNGFTNTIHNHDFRVGGEWNFIMHGPDGTDYPNWMRFDAIDKPNRIDYTQGGKPNDPEAFSGTVSFSEVEGNKTQVVLHLRVASAEVRAGYMKFGAFEGGDQTLTRLAAHLETM